MVLSFEKGITSGTDGVQQRTPLDDARLVAGKAVVLAVLHYKVQGVDDVEVCLAVVVEEQLLPVLARQLLSQLGVNFSEDEKELQFVEILHIVAMLFDFRSEIL